MSLTPDNVLNALAKVVDPDYKKDIVNLGMVNNLEIIGNTVSFDLVFKTARCPYKESLRKASIRSIHDLLGDEIEVIIQLHEKKTSTPESTQDIILPQVKDIIVVASGKGGVGKSTVSANLAVALAASGAKVGLVDADIYGPSVPIMFDVADKQLTSIEVDGKVKVLPFLQYGVAVMSIGFFVDSSRALIWRGPMASGAIKQLFTEVEWGKLDYLIIDLPPGTGDIHLSLVQTLKITGAIVVTTPQKVALADARKAVSMFDNAKVGVKIIGIVENMAWFTPAELPDNKYYIFGKDGGLQLARELDLPLIGQIPLIQSVRESGDNGKPSALKQDDATSAYFHEITQNLKDRLRILSSLRYDFTANN